MVRCSLSVATMTTDNSAIPTCAWLFSDLVPTPAYEIAAQDGLFLLALIELLVVQIRLGRLGQSNRLRTGRNPVHGAQDQEFRITLLQTLAAEEGSQNRDVAESGNFAVNVGYPIVHKAGNDEALSILQLKLGFRFTCAQSGHGESGDSEGIGVIERAHLWRYFQMDVAVWRNHGRELQPHAELLKGDGDRGESVTRLHDRERELASGEKAGFFSVDGNQIRLGENLQEIFSLQSLDYGAEVDIRSKEKQVQNVVDRGSRRGCAAAGALSGGVQSLRAETAELASGQRADCIRGSVRNEVHSHLRQGSAIHFRELNL